MTVTFTAARPLLPLEVQRPAGAALMRPSKLNDTGCVPRQGRRRRQGDVFNQFLTEGGVRGHGNDEVLLGNNVDQLTLVSGGEKCTKASGGLADPPLVPIGSVDGWAPTVMRGDGLAHITLRDNLLSVPSAMLKIQNADFCHVTRGNVQAHFAV